MVSFKGVIMKKIILGLWFLLLFVSSTANSVTAEALSGVIHLPLELPDPLV